MNNNEEERYTEKERSRKSQAEEAGVTRAKAVILATREMVIIQCPAKQRSIHIARDSTLHSCRCRSSKPGQS